MIQIEDLRFRYQNSPAPTLKGVDLNIRPGEWLVISGNSGSGKSTLALALAGFLEKIIPGEMSGQILLDDKDIKTLDIHEVAEKVFLVQQNPENQFCTLTVREELAFGLENRCVPIDEIERRVQSALNAIQAKELIDERLDQLSGGEQQKIAIATALALQPRVLILDEPTSNLDPDAIQALYQALLSLKKSRKMSVVIIEHRTRQLEPLASRQLIVKEGRVFDLKSGIPSKGEFKQRKRASLRPAKAGNPLIELRDLRVDYEERRVLDIESLDFQAGEVASVMGPNGSGKTSLLLGLVGLIPREHSALVMFGNEISHRLPRACLRNFGLVFQNPDHQLFCDSVSEEIYYGPRNFGMGEANEAWIEKLIVDFNFATSQAIHPFLLSYGQKGRLNLASILAFKPRALLLDEIFIGQDLANAHLLLRKIRSYVDQFQAMAIIVNHLAKPVLDYSDRLIFMDKGKVLLDCDAREAERELNRCARSSYLMEAYA